MNYKRLTKKTDSGYSINGNTDVINELGKLEDMLEQGTLVQLDKPYITLSYISNGKEYYSVRKAVEEDLFNNLTKEEAEKKLKELKGVKDE